MNNTHSPSLTYPCLTYPCLTYPCLTRPKPRRTHKPSRARLAQSIVRDSLLDTFFPATRDQSDGSDGHSCTPPGSDGHSCTPPSGFCSLDESSEAPLVTSPSLFLLGEEHCAEEERRGVALADPFDGGGGDGGGDGDDGGDGDSGDGGGDGNGDGGGDGGSNGDDGDAVGRQRVREDNRVEGDPGRGDGRKRGNEDNEEREQRKVGQDVTEQITEEHVMTSENRSFESLSLFSSDRLSLSVPTVSATAETGRLGDDRVEHHYPLVFGGGTLESDSSTDDENPPGTAEDTVFTLRSFATEDVQSSCRDTQGNDSSTLKEHPGNEVSTLKEHPGNEVSTLKEHPGKEASTLKKLPGNEAATLTKSVIARTKALKKLLMQQILARVKPFNDTSETSRKRPNDDTVTNINSLNEETVVHEVTQNEDDNERTKQTQKEESTLNFRISLLENWDQSPLQSYERCLTKSTLESSSTACHSPADDPTGLVHPEVDGGASENTTNLATSPRDTTNSASSAVTSRETVTFINDSQDIDLNKTKDKNAATLRNGKLANNVDNRVKLRNHNERRNKAGRLAPPVKPPRARLSSKTVSPAVSLTEATRRNLMETKHYSPQEALARIFKNNHEVTKSDGIITRRAAEEDRQPFQDEDRRLNFNNNPADGNTIEYSSSMGTSHRNSPVVSHDSHSCAEDGLCNTAAGIADGHRVLHKPPMLNGTDNNMLHPNRSKIKLSRAGYNRKRVREPASSSKTQITPTPQPQGSGGASGNHTPNKPVRTSVHRLTACSLEKDQEPCPDHGAALNFYCVKCRVVICRDCTVVAHQQLESHRVLDTPDSLATLRTEAVTLLRRLEADQSSQVYAMQIESLEKALAQAQADACSWQQNFHQAEENYMTENVKIRSDLTARLERMTKEYEAANKDKESMVIKYATSEREVIVAKKQKEAIEKKMKEMEKEREQLLSKNKMLISERARICQTLDTKVQKNNWYQREVERLKEEINSRDIKIKWAQTKLKTEMDAHQESQGKLDRALTKITKHEEELKTIKEEAESIVRNTRDSENSRANILDMQLKEEKARLIMERQANESRGSAFNRVSAELEALKLKHTALVEEDTSLRTRVATYEAERDETEKLFTSLRLEVTASRQEAADLNHQLSNSAHLQQQLKREREQLAAANQEIDSLQSTNNEIESELLSCRQKEAELLAFTQKLTDKNVQIQSQFSALQSKTQLMELEHEEIKSELDELKVQKSKLKSDFTKENQAHLSQFENLKRQLTEKTEQVKQLTTKTMELENEIQVLNKKHKNSLRDITREMQKLRKRLDTQENGTIGGNGGCAGIVLSSHSSQSVTPHDALSQGSRASSNTSLNTIEYQSTNGSSPHSQELLPPLHDPLVTQQLLVDRIIKLQRSAARRSDKIEFLEEHVSHLVSELKKKSRIIHHYVMREETGALANSASDSSKAELMRHGGIMASVYGSAPRDGTMTLELSLEINQKLQAVLEDTLLKNITLKENLNTLGDEIAKISCQNQQLDCHK